VCVCVCVCVCACVKERERGKGGRKQFDCKAFYIFTLLPGITAFPSYHSSIASTIKTVRFKTLLLFEIITR